MQQDRKSLMDELKFCLLCCCENFGFKKRRKKMNFERKKKLLTAKIFEMGKKNLNQGKHLMKLSSGA